MKKQYLPTRRLKSLRNKMKIWSWPLNGTKLWSKTSMTNSKGCANMLNKRNTRRPWNWRRMHRSWVTTVILINQARQTAPSEKSKIMYKLPTKTKQMHSQVSSHSLQLQGLLEKRHRRLNPKWHLKAIKWDIILLEWGWTRQCLTSSRQFFPSAQDKYLLKRWSNCKMDSNISQNRLNLLTSCWPC